MPATDAPLTFPPILDLDEADPDRWLWPRLPYGWPHEPPPPADQPQPCRIDMPLGTTVDGEMLGFDVPREQLLLRNARSGATVALPFARFRRLTLAAPLAAMRHPDGRLLQRLPRAEHECRYALAGAGDGARTIAGATVGHVDRAEGLFLFEPADDDSALLRLFAPRAGNAGGELGRTALELAAAAWPADPAALHEALDAARRRAVPPLGQAVVSLGLVTPQQLDDMLARVPDSRPLGEVLVAKGLLTPAQLDAAIAHKMGCPAVDVSRFPLQPEALATLPQRLATSYRVLPLMLDERRLVVACAQAMNEEKQRSIRVYTNLEVVPVLAHPTHLMAALRAVPPAAWSVRAV